ncbi:MAG: hypothetical protein Q8K45_20710 [Rubrivivax sp.]|nr:hypothetical protein [Rubrivivax sp.]
MGLIIEAAACPSPLPSRLLPARLKHLFVRCLRGWAAGLGLGLALGAQAQVIDELEFRRDGADAVLAIRFVTPVQFQRSVLARSGDQALVYYRVLPTRQTLLLSTAERRLPARAGVTGGPGLPGVTVTDEGTPGRDSERRLQIRLTAPATLRVRAGRGDRSIELVLPGRGAQVGSVLPPAELPPLAAGRFRVTLQSHDEAGAGLTAAIPASLQDVNVYTTRHVADGRTLYETHLGPFDSRAEALSALAALRGRFPAAAVTTVDDGVRATPASVPPVAAALPASAAEAAAASAPATAVADLPPADPDLDRRAAAQLATAREALARGDSNAAIDGLSALLDLPPNLSSRAAQALIGQARLKAGDTGRARAEFEAFLRLYPSGADADATRAALTAMSPAEAAPSVDGRRVVTLTTLTGSVGSTYYGGQSKVRTQEFQDSLLGGLPELISDNTLSSTDQKQVVSTVDVNWRHRDADVDQRFVFRDAYTRDILRPERNRNKLSSLYYDHRSLALGASVRVGRQSPLGGGVLGRFDGVQASYAFRPRWKAGLVAGAPTDDLLDTRRRFWGASVEAEALTPQFGASLYTVQQSIDGEIDRRAVGTEMRYFDGGVSGNAQLDYDVLLKGLNIASVQGTWQRPDNTVFNLLYDRRNQPLLALGNTLFFTDPNLLLRPTRISELLQTTTLELLRERARATTAVSTQGALGVTTPISPQWQAGADLRYTSTGAVAPVPDILPTGLPASGDIWSVSLQLIGTNLYSPRDTHVVIVNFVNGPTFQGKLLSYNNSSMVFGTWQLEPSLKLYRQSDSTGTTSSRWSPGLRLTWRVVPQAALESEVNVENAKTSGPQRNESSSRTFFYVGGRYDF